MSALTCLSLEPPLFLICVAETADTLPVLLQRRAFAINILRRDQDALAQRFAHKGGTDKFRCFEYVEGVLPGIPVLANTLAVVECELFAAHSGGDHRVVIGEVRAARAHAGEPLLYYRGGYRSIDAAEEGLAGLPNGTKHHLRALEPHLMSAR
jgi:flavin reductase (DIM6/NTAB) family NADH-FMN oxidoreductase RutF